MKKFTLKEAKEILDCKEKWSPHGWSLYRAGAYLVSYGHLRHYIEFNGQGMNYDLYKGNDEIVTDYTDIVESWLHREITKDDAAHQIVERVNEMMEEWKIQLYGIQGEWIPKRQRKYTVYKFKDKETALDWYYKNELDYMREIKGKRLMSEEDAIEEMGEQTIKDAQLIETVE